jgi:hypothetical protein
MRSWPPISCQCKKHRNWCARKGDLQHAFALDRSNGSIIINRRCNRWRSPNVQWILPQWPHSWLEFWVHHCDRTTSEMRGLSPKIISGDSRWSENGQTHTYEHIVPYMKFKLKLLQIKCHVLEFTQDKAQNMLQRIIRVFAEAFVSHDRHTLFTLEESGPPRMTYTYESQ